MHPGAEGGGSESTGALRDTGLATAPAGGDPTTSRQISHVISPRSLFKITRKRCNSNDVDSIFELIARELRATLMGGGRAVSIHAGKESPKEPGQGHDRPAPRRRLLPMRRNTPSVIIQPGPIGRNAPDQVESSRSGGISPHGSNTPKRVERSRSGVFRPMGRILSEALRRGRPSAGILPRRCQRPSRDQRALSLCPDLPGLAHGRAVVWAGRNSHQLRISTWSVASPFL